uniref:Tektin n=1 Tax=Knipowitschia caucasica TaxID=637954 RepID=A0AAV2K5V9_KNICA
MSAVSLKPALRHDVTEWTRNNLELSSVAEHQRHVSHMVRQEGRGLRNQTNCQTNWDEADTNQNLGARVWDVSVWREALDVCAKKVDEEMDALTLVTPTLFHLTLYRHHSLHTVLPWGRQRGEPYHLPWGRQRDEPYHLPWGRQRDEPYHLPWGRQRGEPYHLPWGRQRDEPYHLPWGRQRDEPYHLPWGRQRDEPYHLPWGRQRDEPYHLPWGRQRGEPYHLPWGRQRGEPYHLPWGRQRDEPYHLPWGRQRDEPYHLPWGRQRGEPYHLPWGRQRGEPYHLPWGRQRDEPYHLPWGRQKDEPYHLPWGRQRDEPYHLPWGRQRGEPYHLPWGRLRETSLIICPGADREASLIICPGADRATSLIICPGADRETSLIICPGADREASLIICPGADRETSLIICPGADRGTSLIICPGADREASLIICPGADRETSLIICAIRPSALGQTEGDEPYHLCHQTLHHQSFTRLTLGPCKQQLEQALASTELPLEVVSECLTLREGRAGPELVLDPADLQLKNETSLIQKVQSSLQQLIDQAFEHLCVLQEHRQQLTEDLQNKMDALDIDTACLSLTRTSPQISLKPNPTRTPSGCCSPEEWLQFSRYNIARAQEAMHLSQQMRTEMRLSLAQLQNELDAQRSATEFSLRKRTHHEQQAKDALDWQIQKTEREMCEMEADIKGLDADLQAKTASLKLAHTRLENRTQRPGMDLCRDQVQHGLIYEVSQLEATIMSLKQKLAEAQSSLQTCRLHHSRMLQDLSRKDQALSLEQRSLRTRTRLRSPPLGTDRAPVPLVPLTNSSGRGLLLQQ